MTLLGGFIHYIIYSRKSKNRAASTINFELCKRKLAIFHIYNGKIED